MNVHASVQPGWRCVGMLFATHDTAIISIGSRNNRIIGEHADKKLFILVFEVEEEKVAFKLAHWP